MNEEWREINEKYIVSNRGRVAKIMDGHTKQNRYNMSSITINGKTKTIGTHILVANAFLTKKDKDSVVNHIDSDTSNNDVSNLEWCTPMENTIHGMKFGKIKSSMSDEDALSAYEMLEKGIREKEIKEKFSVSHDTLHRAIRRVVGFNKPIVTNRYRHSLSERIEIKRKILESDKTNMELSKDINVSSRLIGEIRSGKKWTDISVDCNEAEKRFLPTTSITNSEAIRIKADIIDSFNNGESIVDTIERLGFDRKTLYNIRKGITWKSVPYKTKQF